MTVITIVLVSSMAKLYLFLVLASAVALAFAQRPDNTSICDYYTTALLNNNTAANQLTLLTLLVNTAVVGNCKTTLVAQ
jgi:hypothetical protein